MSAAHGSWSQHPLRRFARPALLLAGVLVGGTLGYMLIEGWDLADSAFMTVITVSTVGYQEVHPLSLAGRLFSIGLIVVGVGTMLYSLGLFAELVSGGQLSLWRMARQLDRDVSALRGHFILCGYGRIGTQVVAELERAGVPYLAIDNNPEAVGRLSREGRLFLEGDAASEEVLRRAGVERARGLVCAVDADERAVYITLAARSLNPRLFIIARAGQPESLRRLQLAGADRVLSPYQMAGHRMAEMALRPGVVEVIDTLRSGSATLGVEEIVVPQDWRRAGSTVREAGLADRGTARILALRRPSGELFVGPADDQVVLGGDLLVVLGSAVEVDRTALVLS
ncbi:MAG: potassium channel family protein [Candidatus Dormibacteria bacterium]